MSEYQLTDGEAAALSAQIIGPGAVVPTTDAEEWDLALNRALWRLASSLLGAVGFEVYKDGDLVIGVRPGTASDGVTMYTHAGCAGQAVTDDATNYVYLTVADLAAGNTVTVNQTGFPLPTATPHIPLAIVTAAGGVFHIDDMVDVRGRAVFPVLTGFASSDAAILEHLEEGIPLAFAAFPTWAVDGDGAMTNGAGLVGEPTLTEVGATYAYCYDLGTTTYAALGSSSSLTGWTANWQLTADAANVQIGDAFYVGAAKPFNELAFNLGGAGQVATYSDDSLTSEYWNGSAWVALPNEYYDNTDVTAPATGFRPWQRTGAVAWAIPSDWAMKTVNGINAYWARWIVTAAHVTQEPKTNAKRPYVVTPKYGVVAAHDGLVFRLRASDGAATLHTAADVVFELVNYTTGLSSVLTWPMDERVHVWTGLALAVAAGDVLGICVLVEDGTNEASGVMVELVIVPT